MIELIVKQTEEKTSIVVRDGEWDASATLHKPYARKDMGEALRLLGEILRKPQK